MLALYFYLVVGFHHVTWVSAWFWWWVTLEIIQQLEEVWSPWNQCCFLLTCRTVWTRSVGFGFAAPFLSTTPLTKESREVVYLAAPWMVTRLGAGHSFGAFSVHFFTDDNSPCSRNAREIHEFSPLELIFKAWAGCRAPLHNPAEFPWQKHEGWEVGIGTGKWGCWLWDFWSLHFSSENWKWDS